MMCGKRDENAERDWQRDRQSEKVERGREKRGEWERNKGAERERERRLREGGRGEEEKKERREKRVGF